MGQLLRKQFLVTKENVEKLTLLSNQANQSTTEIVRRAIEAYQPGLDYDETELLELAIEKNQEAISSIRETTRLVETLVSELKEKRRDTNV